MRSMRLVSLIAASAPLLLLFGCSSERSSSFVAKHEPWRAADERQCLSAGMVRPGRFVEARSSLGGPSACGAVQPFVISAALGGAVGLAPSATLRCPMIPAVDRWLAEVVIPAARHYYGSPVVELKVAASYACRPINHKWGAKLSEHGLANAIDISTFRFANGRDVTVKQGWWGDSRERAFLRAVHRGACDTFTTVLGPMADRYHQDHFHLDLARHGRDGTYRVCR